jgi:hypothetical protein
MYVTFSILSVDSFCFIGLCDKCLCHFDALPMFLSLKPCNSDALTPELETLGG